MRSERAAFAICNFALNGCGGSGRVRNGSLKCKPPPLSGTRLLSVRLYIPKNTVILQEYIIIFCAKSYLKSTCGSRGFGAVCTAQKKPFTTHRERLSLPINPGVDKGPQPLMFNPALTTCASERMKTGGFRTLRVSPPGSECERRNP